MAHSSRRAARLAVLLLLVGFAGAIWLSPLRAHLTRDEIRAAIEGVRAAWYAPLLLIAIYAAGCVFAIPASLFIVTAGAIWGWALGGTYAMAGGLLGAMASFYSARFVGGDSASGGGKARELFDTHVRGAGFRSLLIVRLLPVLPFAALNYGAGLARVSPAAFFFSTLIGLVPSNYVFAWSADEVFNGTLSGSGVLLRLFTVAAVCVAIVIASSAAARHLQRRAPTH